MENKDKFLIQIEYLNSKQWLTYGFYHTYAEAISNVSEAADTYVYGFGDINVSHFNGKRWESVFTIPRW